LRRWPSAAASRYRRPPDVVVGVDGSCCYSPVGIGAERIAPVSCAKETEFWAVEIFVNLSVPVRLILCQLNDLI